MQCQAFTQAGTQCTRPAQSNSNFCWQHQNYQGEIKEYQPELISDLEDIMAGYADLDTYMTLMQYNPKKYTIQKLINLIGSEYKEIRDRSLKSLNQQINVLRTDPKFSSDTEEYNILLRKVELVYLKYLASLTSLFRTLMDENPEKYVFQDFEPILERVLREQRDQRIVATQQELKSLEQKSLEETIIYQELQRQLYSCYIDDITFIFDIYAEFNLADEIESGWISGFADVDTLNKIDRVTIYPDGIKTFNLAVEVKDEESTGSIILPIQDLKNLYFIEYKDPQKKIKLPKTPLFELMREDLISSSSN